MKTTSVFSKTLEVYNQRFRMIANVWGTRSRKTFSDLQIIYLTNGPVMPDDIISAESDYSANLIYSGKVEE